MKVTFLSKLNAVKVLPNDPEGAPVKDEDTGLQNFRLTDFLLLELDDGVRRLRITIPKGYVTDLLSIPWFARWFFDPEDPEGARPAVLHDWLYTNKGIVTVGIWTGTQWAVLKANLSREFCDSALRDGLTEEGYHDAVARLFRWAVHEFGQKQWDDVG